MAELLVKAVSVTNIDSKKDNYCYKRGDIVDIRPNGFIWGREESPPIFYIVKITDISDSTYKHLISSQYDLTDPKMPKMIKRRIWNFLIDDPRLSISAKNELKNTGIFTTTKSAIAPLIQNKLTAEIMK